MASLARSIRIFAAGIGPELRGPFALLQIRSQLWKLSSEVSTTGPGSLRCSGEITAAWKGILIRPPLGMPILQIGTAYVLIGQSATQHCAWLAIRIFSRR